MVQRLRLSIPVIAVAALLGATVMAVHGGLAGGGKPADQVLYTAGGAKVLATFDGQGYKALASKAGAQAPLADGYYKLSNGGAIRVKAGKIVWDAFGAIERLKSRGFAECLSEPGLG